MTKLESALFTKVFQDDKFVMGVITNATMSVRGTW